VRSRWLDARQYVWPATEDRKGHRTAGQIPIQCLRDHASVPNRLKKGDSAGTDSQLTARSYQAVYEI
jgi:hypothetical protein